MAYAGFGVGPVGVGAGIGIGPVGVGVGVGLPVGYYYGDDGVLYAPGGYIAGPGWYGKRYWGGRHYRTGYRRHWRGGEGEDQGQDMMRAGGESNPSSQTPSLTPDQQAFMSAQQQQQARMGGQENLAGGGGGVFGCDGPAGPVTDSGAWYWVKIVFYILLFILFIALIAWLVSAFCGNGSGCNGYGYGSSCCGPVRGCGCGGRGCNKCGGGGH